MKNNNKKNQLYAQKLLFQTVNFYTDCKLQYSDIKIFQYSK